MKSEAEKQRQRNADRRFYYSRTPEQQARRNERARIQQIRARRLRNSTVGMLCKRCGGRFFPVLRRGVKYCSIECRDEARLEQRQNYCTQLRARYWSLTPEQKAQRSRQWCAWKKQSQGRKNLETGKICKRCGNRFFRSNHRFDYCSVECHDEARRQRERIQNKSSEVKAKRNTFLREKNRRNAEFRLRGIVSKTVWRALRNRGARKCGSITKFLPYSIPQLKAHLEVFFDNRNGFTWENYGSVWHIDHVIPQAMFAYTALDSKAFRDCWALSNLRPMPKLENIRKGARRVGYFESTGQQAFIA